ncbi:MAG: hypothetical protein KKD86_15665, partial [Bacteroidetes bacterium]|nr:hypothetical protein [Bacteroidota bacterium]
KLSILKVNIHFSFIFHMVNPPSKMAGRHAFFHTSLLFSPSVGKKNTSTSVRLSSCRSLSVA